MSSAKIIRENNNIAASGRESSGVVRHGHARRLFETHMPDKEGYILDLGCGKGVFMGELREAGYRHIAGMDANDYEISEEEVKTGFRTEPVKHGDFVYEKLPWADESFDAVTAWEVFEHLENPHAVMREVYRVLKPGGYLMLSMPNAAHLESRLMFLRSGELRRWTEKNDHISVFTGHIFKKTFLKYFDPVEVRYPVAMLGKHGMLGWIRYHIRFIDRRLPENQWFGYYVVYILQKK